MSKRTECDLFWKLKIHTSRKKEVATAMSTTTEVSKAWRLLIEFSKIKLFMSLIVMVLGILEIKNLKGLNKKMK